MYDFKTFEELELNEQNDFMNAKNQYLTHDCPLIKYIYNEFKDICDMLSVWVTEYGSVEGDEESYRDLYNIFTQCGCSDIGEPYLSVDFHFKDENEQNHEIISSILRSGYEDDDWYRLESGDLNDYIEKLRKVKAFLELTQANKKEVKKHGKGEILTPFKTKATIMPHDTFMEYAETLRNIGIGHIADYSNPSNDRYFILQPKAELFGNLAEVLVDTDAMSEDELKAEFDSLAECDVTTLLNVSYVTTERIL